MDRHIKTQWLSSLTIINLFFSSSLTRRVRKPDTQGLGMLLYPLLHQGIELSWGHVAPVPRDALPEEAPDSAVGRGAEDHGDLGVASLHLRKAGMFGDPAGGAYGAWMGRGKGISHEEGEKSHTLNMDKYMDIFFFVDIYIYIFIYLSSYL